MTAPANRSGSRYSGWHLVFLFSTLSGFATPVVAKEMGRLAIVIDDIGYDRQRGLEAISLPGRMTIAVIPHTPNGALLANAAFEAGKEVILHQPMQGSDFTSHNSLPRGTMTLAMGPADIGLALNTALASVPHCVGINNHTGSTLTEARSHMYWLMQKVAGSKLLYYLDSRTSSATVADEAAQAWGVPFVSRDVFLDHVNTRDALERQFDQALALVRRRGHALLIAHPRPLSLALLQRRLPMLEALGIEIVPASDLVHATRPLPTTTLMTVAAGD